MAAAAWAKKSPQVGGEFRHRNFQHLRAGWPFRRRRMTKNGDLAIGPKSGDEKVKIWKMRGLVSTFARCLEQLGKLI